MKAMLTSRKIVRRRASWALMLMATLSVCALAPRAEALSLESLINSNGSITQGDKLFDNFAFSSSGSGSYYYASPTDLDVIGQTFGQDHGLKIAGPFFVGAGSTLNVTISYTVTVTDPLKYISAMGLTFNGATTGSGSTSITESAYIPNTNTLIGQGTVTAPSPLTTIFSLDPNPGFYQSVHVVNDIMLAGGEDGTASISLILESYTQEVIPEPAGIVSLAVGLAGMLRFSRRRR